MTMIRFLTVTTQRVLVLLVLGSSWMLAEGADLASMKAGTAAAGGEESAPPQGLGISAFYMLIIFVLFMYFAIFRPNNKEQKRRRGMMDDLKVGDKVVTIGGLHGKVARRGEQDLDLEVAPGTIMTFNMGAVNQVLKDGELPAKA
jgi:preprotein translocase subunit YajC